MIIGIGVGAAALFLCLGGQSTAVEKLKQGFASFLYEEVLDWYMPAAGSQDLPSASPLGEKGIAQHLLAHFFPVTGFLSQEKEALPDYPLQVESELSYEMILAWEASDENYVDEETKKVIAASGEPLPQAVEEMPKLTEEADLAQGAATAYDAVGTYGMRQKAVTYPREKLNDFDYLIQNFYQVDNTTTIDGNQLNAAKLLEKNMKLTHDASTPQILIYHTHSQEGYADSIPGDLGTSVVGVGDYLTNLLTEKYGFSVIHHRGTYDVESRDHAYSKAAPALEQLLAENPSIEVVIDLHRDGVGENTRLVTNIDGKQTAQVMFFNGLSRTTKMGDIGYLYNPNIEDNLAISFQMQLAAAEYYPGFTRRIYLKGYRYNMHYCPKTLLIEVGAQTNTFEEALNAMEPLADVLHTVLMGQQES
ncbi:MAG: stage II sporulation protein P [Clostridiales bacterium]|nr:stage II sporulation protein P [Clostridiales bacterium]